jgi:hypothetical protein
MATSTKTGVDAFTPGRTSYFTAKIDFSDLHYLDTGMEANVQVQVKCTFTYTSMQKTCC